MVIPQICLCTVTSSNQQFHIFSQFSLIVLIMPHPFPICLRHEVLALAREGLRQRAIAGRVVLTRATVNCILWRHAATGTVGPGKSIGARRKSTPRQDMLCWGWSDRIASYVLGPWRHGWGICMEWGLAGKQSTTSSCSVVTVLKDPQGSHCSWPATAASTGSGSRGSRTWQWPIGTMSSSVTSQDSNFTREMAGL